MRSLSILQVPSVIEEEIVELGARKNKSAEVWRGGKVLISMGTCFKVGYVVALEVISGRW